MTLRGRRVWPALILMLVASPALAAPKAPQIVTEDVARFYRVYDAAGGRPSAEALDRDYLAPGTSGLHEFARLRRVTGAAMADNIANHPEVYVGARRCLSVLPKVTRRLTADLGKLARLYPEMKAAPVTFVVGRGKPVGITNPSGVTMGLEALCAADFMNPNLEDRFVHNIAHEYGHIQQPRADDSDQPGVTVLLASLIEGGAEFTAELISGDIGNYQLKAATRGREAQIETAFVADEDKTDLSAWLYNHPDTPERPADLGYWVGYRIVKAYYAHAADKHQALRDIFEMKDPKAFLTASGWRPQRP